MSHTPAMRRLTLPVRRITRDELDVFLHRDMLRRRAEAGSIAALTQLTQGWPEYVPETLARLLLNDEQEPK